MGLVAVFEQVLGEGGVDTRYLAPHEDGLGGDAADGEEQDGDDQLEPIAQVVEAPVDIVEALGEGLLAFFEADKAFVDTRCGLRGNGRDRRDAEVEQEEEEESAHDG